MLQVNQLKAEEGTNHRVPASVEAGGLRNGMIPPLSSGALIERSMLEARNRLLLDGRLLQAQQAPALPGAYAPQKEVSYWPVNFFSLPGAHSNECMNRFTGF